MAMTRGEAAMFTVQCPGATAPVTATIGGAASAVTPTLADDTLDSYVVALTDAETDAATLYLLITDAASEEYGFTIVTDEPTEGVPDGWVLIDHTTLDTEGVALGPLDAADVLIVAYSGSTLVASTRSEGDGGFEFHVPPSATYTVRALRVGYTYDERTVDVP